MTNMACLRSHHDAVELMIDEVFAAIDQCRSDLDAAALSEKLGRLARLLRAHFAMEDHGLYPAMIESDHRQAALVALVFRNELDQLGGQFERFFDRWSDGDAIAASLRQFEYEAGMLFAELRDRVHRENRDLYPLAEEVCALKKASAALEPGDDRLSA